MAARNIHLSKRLLGALPLLALASTGTVWPQALFPLMTEIPVSVTSGTLASPRVSVLPNGGFVAAWTADGQRPHSHRAIRARFFAPNGTPRSGEIDLHQPADQYLDDLAAAADGGFWVVWEQPDRNQLLSVLARRCDRRGRPLTPAFVVHDPSPNPRYDARLAVAPDGGVVIAWLSWRLVDSVTVTDIVVRFFGADGTPRSPELNLGPGAQDISFPAGIGLAPDGSAWVLEEHDSLTEFVLGSLTLQRVAADGTAGPSFPVCEGSAVCTPSASTFPFAFQGALAMRRDGSFVVLWAYYQGENAPAPDRSVIQGRLFATDGRPLGDAFQVNAGHDSEVIPLVAALPDGRFLTLWSDLADDATLAGVYGRSFAADGTPDSGDFRLRDGSPGALAAGIGDAAVAVFLSPRGTIVARRFAAPRDPEYR